MLIFGLFILVEEELLVCDLRDDEMVDCEMVDCEMVDCEMMRW